MYDNVGGNIKGLAKLAFVLLTLSSIIIGIVIWGDIGWLGALIVFGGPIVALVSSWFLYGFGEIIEMLCDIEQNTRGEKTKIKETTERTKKEAVKKIDNKYIDVLCPNCHENLTFEKGMIEVQCPFCDCKFKIDK